MQSFLKTACDVLGLLAILIFTRWLLPVEWRLIVSPAPSDLLQPIVRSLWGAWISFLPGTVAGFISVWIMHHVLQSGSLRWRTILLVSTVWLFVFPVLAYVSVYVYDLYYPLRGELGIAFLFVLIYAAYYAAVLTIFIIGDALLIRYVPCWWKWMYGALGFLIAVWIILLASNGFCSRTDGACSAKQIVRRGLDAAFCTKIPDFQGCLTAYVVATKSPSTCGLIPAEYSRRCMAHEEWYQRHGMCRADGVNALRALNSCRIRFSESIGDPGVCAQAPLENNNRFTCCMYAYHLEQAPSELTREQQEQCGIPLNSESSSSSSSVSSSSDTSVSSLSSSPLALFRNIKYGYSLWHPPACSLRSNDFGVLDASQAMNVSVCRLSIEPQDPEGYGGKYPEMQLPLRELAEIVWRMNAEDKNPYIRGKNVGPLLSVTIAERTAYQFSLDTSYTDYRGGRLLKQESTVTLFSDGRMNFIAIYESADEKAKRVLDSLTLGQ